MGMPLKDRVMRSFKRIGPSELSMFALTPKIRRRRIQLPILALIIHLVEICRKRLREFRVSRSCAVVLRLALRSICNGQPRVRLLIFNDLQMEKTRSRQCAELPVSTS
jgi:hypothetical protein